MIVITDIAVQVITGGLKLAAKVSTSLWLNVMIVVTLQILKGKLFKEDGALHCCSRCTSSCVSG